MPSIKYKKKTYAGATFPVLEMTKAEYDALPEAKKMDGTVYMITDDTGGWEAENASYDNTESGLTATNVQDALDEIVSDVNAATYTTRKITYGSNQNIASGGFVLSFNAALSGYTPVALISYGLEDRSLGGKVFITGLRVASDTADILGYANAAWAISSIAYVIVLYKKS